MKTIKVFNPFLGALFLLLSSNSFAGKQEKLNIGDIKKIILEDIRAGKLSGMPEISDEDVDEMINAITGESGDREITFSGALSKHTSNFGCFKDTNRWDFDATVKDVETDNTIRFENLFEVTVRNGGLKMEWCYKWMWIFVPEEVLVAELDGAVYEGKIFGRGLGLTLIPIVGGSASVMTSKKLPGTMWVLTLSLGIGKGISFPQMEFKLNVEDKR